MVRILESLRAFLFGNRKLFNLANSLQQEMDDGKGYLTLAEAKAFARKHDVSEVQVLALLDVSASDFDARTAASD